METKEKETELVQLIRQLKDCVILERKDYEKLVQNSSPEKFNQSALGQKCLYKTVRTAIGAPRRLDQLLEK